MFSVLLILAILVFGFVPLPRTWKAPPFADARLPVYDALSELFLDTHLDTRAHVYLARRLAASPYDEAAIEAILRDEVAPVVAPNLLSLAGVWGAFEPAWLHESCRTRALAGGIPWTTSIVGRLVAGMGVAELRAQTFPKMRLLRAGPAPHLAALEGSDAQILDALQAIYFLHDHGRSASEPVARLLGHDSGRIRAHALRTYVAIAEPLALRTAVRAALDDTDWTVRITALQRLGPFDEHDDATTRARVASSLERVLRGASDERWLAAEAWLRLAIEPRERARDALVAGLASELHPPNDRCFDLFTRLHVRPTQLEAYLLRTLAPSDDESARRKAAQGAFRWLGRFAGSDVKDDADAAKRLTQAATRVLRPLGN